MTYAPGVTLITCTGDRPQAFALCNRFVGRQTYTGPLQWVIVDDCIDPDPATLMEGAFMAINRAIPFIRLHPRPSWQPGQNTLARNLLAAIPEVMHDKVLFIEDDDWYPADYVERMAERLDQASIRHLNFAIVGDPDSLYYHLPSRRYRMMMNGRTASLCQTGIRAELLPLLEKVCREDSRFIDVRLWQRVERRLLTHIGGVVGIKGLPGRPGIGVGHRPDSRPCEWTADEDLSVLRRCIGDDISLYREFMQ